MAGHNILHSSTTGQPEMMMTHTSMDPQRLVGRFGGILFSLILNGSRRPVDQGSVVHLTQKTNAICVCDQGLLRKLTSRVISLP